MSSDTTKNKQSEVYLGYSGHKDTLEVILRWRDLEVIVDAVKEYEEKYNKFDEITQETFDTLKEILKEQEHDI